MPEHRGFQTCFKVSKSVGKWISTTSIEIGYEVPYPKATQRGHLEV